MDVYLPDEFYALSELPNARRERAPACEAMDWLGGEAFVAPLHCGVPRQPRAEPDPIWRVI